jgi:hypothetical protein
MGYAGLGFQDGLPFPTVIRVDHPAGVVELEAEFGSGARSREYQGHVAGRNRGSEAKAEKPGLTIGDTRFWHIKVEGSGFVGTLLA